MKHVFSSRFQGVGRWIQRAVLCLWLVLGAGLPQEVVGSAVPVSAFSIRPLCPDSLQTPESMKTYLQQAARVIEVTPDSLPLRLADLQRRAATETDTLRRALWQHWSGYYLLDTSQGRSMETVEQTIDWYRKALQPVERLGREPLLSYASWMYPKKVPTRYGMDNLYQWLTEQSIHSLLSVSVWHPSVAEAAQAAALEFYDDLMAFYRRRQQREALMLVQLDALYVRTHEVSQGGCGDRFRWTWTQAVDSLQQWAVRYADSPLCGEVYCQLANAYHELGQREAKLAAARTGLERYPQTISVHDLKEQILEVTEPSLTVSCPFAYPGVEESLQVRFRNLSGFTLQVYRVDLPVTSRYLEEPLHAGFLRRYARRVDSRHYALTPDPQHAFVDTLLTFRFPEAGIYVLKSLPDGYPKQAEYQLLHLSVLQAVSIGLPDQQQEFTVVDKRTGHPVAGAKVAFYEIAPDRQFQRVKEWITDAQGRVTLVPPVEKGWLGMQVYSATDAFMEITYAGTQLPSFSKAGTVQAERHVRLFTDRVLYRPGQPLQVAGWIYRQEGDRTEALSGASIEGTLRDAHGQVVKQATWRSDSFGSFHDRWVLPDDLLPGEYVLTTADATPCYIRVDEFRRPTFEVVLTPPDRVYDWGDTLQLSGRVATLAGSPLAATRLTYRWIRTPRGQEKVWEDGETVASGQLQTDVAGTFRVPVTFTRPAWERPTPTPSPEYLYRLSVDVVADQGERQTASLSMPVGGASLRLHWLQGRSKLARQRLDSLRVGTWNRFGQPASVPLQVGVYALDAHGRKQEVVGLRTQVQAFQPFRLDGLQTCPVGRYVLEAQAVDAAGRTYRREHPFTLCSLDDCRPPFRTVEWFYQDVAEFVGTQPVNLYVGSSEEDLYLFYDVFCGSRRLASQRMRLSNEVRRFRFVYRPEYGDGLTVHFAFLHRGICYTREVRIPRAKPDKRLQLYWKTFRDRLQPGSQETWELEVRTPQGTPADAQLLAVLYDASLDRLYAHDWDFALDFPRRLSSVSASRMYDRYGVQLYGHGFRYDSGERAHGLHAFDLLRPSKLPRWRTSAMGHPFREQPTSHLPLPRREGDTGISGDWEPEQEVTYPQDAGFQESGSGIAVVECQSGTIQLEPNVPYQPLRTHFAETAFFYPDLRTDSAGVVRLPFLLPESLTEWRLMALAHTRNLDYGRLEARVRAEKLFHIQPHLPRFVRAGDEAQLRATVTSLTGRALDGQARLEWVVPATGRVWATEVQPFHLSADSLRTTVRFTQRFTDEYPVLMVRFTASTDEASDGEQHYLPVLSNREWVTEGRWIPLRDTDQQTVAVPAWTPFQAGEAARTLTVELTASPEMKGVLALPVNRPVEAADAVSQAEAYYTQRLSQHLLATHPQWRAVWDTQGKAPAILDPNTAAAEQQGLLRRLAALQGADGSWIWYPGMPGSRAVTTQVMEHLARLQAVLQLPEAVQSLYRRGHHYLQQQLQERVKELQEVERKGKKPVVDPLSVDALYIAAWEGEMETADHTYLWDCLERQYASLFRAKPGTDDRLPEGVTLHRLARWAFVAHRSGRTALAQTLIRWLLDYSVYIPDQGRYYDTHRAAYAPGVYRLPTQLAVMEVLALDDAYAKEWNEMREWLLQQSLGLGTDSPWVTVETVRTYARAMSASATERTGRQLEARVGRVIVKTPEGGAVPVSYTCAGSDVPSEVTMKQWGTGTGWAILAYRRWEPMKELRSAPGSGLRITRTYYKGGKKVTKKTPLQVGDSLTVVLTVRADRDMDFLCIEDSRPACLEPTQTLSGYERFEGFERGGGYYRKVHDASTEFFFEVFPKGTRQWSYPVYVDRAGTYQAGTARVQSVYAPAFTAHSETQVLTVEE